MDNNLHQQVTRGTRAKALLDDPLLKEGFEYLFEQYRTEIFNTNYKDDEQRQVLWMAFNGKLASSELEQLTRQSKNT
jgi:hypothetical protein